MFERAALEGALADLVTVPHTVTLLSPFSFEIQPSHQGDGVEYRVVAERIAFELRVSVATGYMAVGLRSAVVAGAIANPLLLNRLIAALESIGWLSDIRLSRESFQIAAKRQGIVDLTELELMQEAAEASALMSEFVLDQLVITRPYGEMRPAVLREVAEEADSSDPWLYDPAERDRSSAVHRALENWLIDSLESTGLRPLDPTGEPFFDVAWTVGDTLFVCEVKSTINSETKQLRLATGQLLHYMAILRGTREGPVRGVILGSDRPKDELWLSLLAGLDVTLLWPQRWGEVQDALTGHPEAQHHAR